MKFVLILCLFFSLSIAQFPRFNIPRINFGFRRPSRPSRPTFNSQPSFSSSQFSSQPSFNSQPSFSSQPSFNSQPSFSSQPSFNSQPVRTSGSSGNANHNWNGKRYLLTWRQGLKGFSHDAARSYCRSQGMKIVSLDSSDKVQHFLNLVGSDRAEYFWAGGRISPDKRTLTWENGRSERINRGQFPWSHAGSRGPQPDGVGSEHCLAILNNVYNDAVKFHDVGCSHTKPTVCEE